MKNFQPFKYFFLVIVLSLSFIYSVFGQNQATIQSRFSNPQFLEESRTYCLDVELKTDVSGLKIYGMNVRFFYDASILTYKEMKGFQPGYAQVSPFPAEVTKGDLWGTMLFNTESSAASVNGAVQLVDQNSSIELPLMEWRKLFQVCFEVPESVTADQPFCPSVIWDYNNASSSSFLRRSGGLVVTTVEDDQSVVGQNHNLEINNFNWEIYQEQITPPFGMPLAIDCINLSGQVTGSGGIESHKFLLMQNLPNPFDQATRIGFILPEDSSAKLIFFDIAGKEVKVIEGDFAQGMNEILLDKKEFNQVNNVLFYRLETPDRKSGYKKMIFIN
jgi:hypothetical protein